MEREPGAEAMPAMVYWPKSSSNFFICISQRHCVTTYFTSMQKSLSQTRKQKKYSATITRNRKDISCGEWAANSHQVKNEKKKSSGNRDSGESPHWIQYEDTAPSPLISTFHGCWYSFIDQHLQVTPPLLLPEKVPLITSTMTEDRSAIQNVTVKSSPESTYTSPTFVSHFLVWHRSRSLEATNLYWSLLYFLMDFNCYLAHSIWLNKIHWSC